MTETDPSARVQPRQVGQLLSPSVCALCGNGTCMDGYVDPSIFYEWEGQVYFCKNCTVEMAKIFGMVEAEEQEFLKSQAEGLAADNAILNEEIKVLRERLAIFMDALSGVDASAVAALGTPRDGTEAESVESGAVIGANDESATNGTEPDAEPSESVKKRVRRNGPARPTSGDSAFSI